MADLSSEKTERAIETPYPCLLRREIVSFEEDGGGIFDGVVDLCAVLVCCGERPKRLDSMREQLRMLRPLSRVELCFFSGREACGSANSSHDLSRNFRYLFEDALARGARSLLVLEDDFVVPRPPTPKQIASIRTFLRLHADDVDVYGLGNWTIPTLDTLFRTHQRSALHSLIFAHACIYSSRYMSTVVNFFRGRDIPSCFHAFDNWPVFFQASAYRFHTPLVFQTFPATENQTTSWGIGPGNGVGGPDNNLGMRVAISLLRSVNLQEQLRPGWTLIYFGGFAVWGLLFLILLVLARALWVRVR